MSVSLYELTNELLQLQYMLEECNEEDEITEDMIKDTIEALEGDLEYKMQGCAIVRQNLKNDYEAIDKEIKRLSKIANSLKNNIKRVENAMQDSMVVLNQRKVKTKLFNIYIQNNPPSLSIDAPIDNIPKEYLIEQEPKINKKQIMQDIKDGVDINFAHVEQGESIRIK
jgi:tRNA(Ile)-lysidine synthase TilS/MesJ